MWLALIPDATKLHRPKENLGSVSVELSADNLRGMAAASHSRIEGARLNQQRTLLRQMHANSRH